MTTQRRRTMACAFALTLLAAGCADQAASGSGDSDKSPLTKYMGDDHALSGNAMGGTGMLVVQAGSMFGADSEPSDKQLAQQREVEDRVARCMRDQGFEYIPAPVERPEKTEFDKAYELPPDEFAEQYGYGISTLMWDAGSGGGSDEPEDPNESIRSKLSEQAKKAYDKALYGDGGGMAVTLDAGGGAAPAPTRVGKPGAKQDTGCHGKAQEQVFGSNPEDFMQQQQEFDGLFEDLEALRQRIDADPRVTEAAEAWSNCMADNGHPGLDKPDDASGEVSAKLDKLLGVGQPSDDSGSGTSEAQEPVEIQAPDPKQLDKVQEFELALAETDFECRADHYDEAYENVQYEREQEFVDEHRNELERYRDWQAEQQQVGN